MIQADSNFHFFHCRARVTHWRATHCLRADYGELHQLAHARLRQGGRNAVPDTTCLVHGSYLRESTSLARGQVIRSPKVTLRK
jgi:hypothetical protein